MPADKTASAMIAVTPPAVEHDPGGLLDVGASVVACAVLPDADDGPRVGLGAADLADILTVDAAEALRREGKTGKAGEIQRLPGTGDVTLVLLVGVGDGSPAAFRKAGAAVARAGRYRPAGQHGYGRSGRRRTARVRRSRCPRFVRLAGPWPVEGSAGHAGAHRIRPGTGGGGGRRGRCRGRFLVRPRPGAHALEHQGSELAGRSSPGRRRPR